jgi:hypothetical protein
MKELEELVEGIRTRDYDTMAKFIIESGVFQNVKGHRFLLELSAKVCWYLSTDKDELCEPLKIIKNSIPDPFKHCYTFLEESSSIYITLAFELSEGSIIDIYFSDLIKPYYEEEEIYCNNPIFKLDDDVDFVADEEYLELRKQSILALLELERFNSPVEEQDLVFWYYKQKKWASDCSIELSQYFTFEQFQFFYKMIQHTVVDIEEILSIWNHLTIPLDLTTPKDKALWLVKNKKYFYAASSINDNSLIIDELRDRVLSIKSPTLVNAKRIAQKYCQLYVDTCSSFGLKLNDDKLVYEIFWKDNFKKLYSTGVIQSDQSSARIFLNEFSFDPFSSNT